jgi:hypothetical protein
VLSTTVCTDTGASPAEGNPCVKEASVYLEGAAPAADTRKTVEVCKTNNVIPSNLTAAQKYGLTTTKYVITNKLSNTLQQAAYERYLTTLENSVYLTADPATAVCALPLGPENAPVVDISSPTANQSVEVGNTVTISGSVAFLESISSFTVKFDGNSIAGASMEPNGSFTVTYVIPSSTSIGIHTLNVTAVDNYGKSNSASVNINVVAAGSSISLSIISPSNGANVSGSVDIVANSTGGSVNSVSFFIERNGEPIDSAIDSDGTNGWVYRWKIPVSLAHGTYTIRATASRGGATITAPSITVNY